MSNEDVHGLLQEYSKRPYVEGTVLTSKMGVPIASNESTTDDVKLIAPLVGITYEGAHELANSAGQDFDQLNVELGNGSRIVIKSLKGTFLLVVQVHKYNEQIQKEINHLSNQVLEYLSTSMHSISLVSGHEVAINLTVDAFDTLSTFIGTGNFKYL